MSKAQEFLEAYSPYGDQYRKHNVSGRGSAGGFSPMAGLPRPDGARQNIHRKGTPQELIKRLRSVVMASWNSRSLGHFTVDVEVVDNMLFVEMSLHTPVEREASHLQMVTSRMAKQTFPQHSREGKVEVEFHRKRSFLEGVTISVEDINVQDFKHSFGSENLGRTQH